MLRIRQGSPEDAPALSKLAYRSKASWGYSPETMEACRDEFTYHETDFPSFYFALAEDPQLVGFYCLGFLTDTETQLHGLFVDPDYMGQGYARKDAPAALPRNRPILKLTAVCGRGRSF